MPGNKANSLLQTTKSWVGGEARNKAIVCGQEGESHRTGGNANLCQLKPQ